MIETQSQLCAFFKKDISLLYIKPVEVGVMSDVLNNSTHKQTEKNTAKVFMSGRSQAVRIPKAFRFDVDEVVISKNDKGQLILYEKPTQADVPDDFMSSRSQHGQAQNTFHSLQPLLNEAKSVLAEHDNKALDNAALLAEALELLISIKKQQKILAMQGKLHWQGDLDAMRESRVWM